jgi:hypothetical protein
MTHEPGVTCTPCPITGCGWHLDIPPAHVVSEPQLVDGQVRFRTIDFHKVEAVLREHLNYHSVLEWLFEVQSQEKRIQILRTELQSIKENIVPSYVCSKGCGQSFYTETARDVHEENCNGGGDE